MSCLKGVDILNLVFNLKFLDFLWDYCIVCLLVCSRF